jgi:uncharacterized protein YecE (DUF72 family)
MPVHIGEARLVGDFARYAKRFSFLELDTEPGRVPAKARLRTCAEQAPDGFVFSLIVPSLVASLEPSDEALQALRRAQTIATLLESKWWVVRTPAQVRPTRRTREQLAELFTRLREGERRIAWEPRGVWEDTAAAETAAELGVHLVRDVAQQAPPAAPTLYSRILALGRGTRVGLGLAAAVAERLHGFDEAFVVVEGRGALELSRAVIASAEELDEPRALKRSAPLRAPSPEDDDSLEDDDELDDEASEGDDETLDEDLDDEDDGDLDDGDLDDDDLDEDDDDDALLESDLDGPDDDDDVEEDELDPDDDDERPRRGKA